MGRIPGNEEIGLAYRSIPEGTAQLDGFQQDWFGLFETKVGSQSKTHAHCSEAWRGDLDAAEGECLHHFGGFVGLLRGWN